MSRIKSDCTTKRSCAMKTALMMFAVVVFAVVTIYAFTEKPSVDARTIRMAAILFRHGEKNPTSFYPNDPHVKHEWTGGLGALTAKGSQQTYKLGKTLNSRYHPILPKNGLYSQQDMHVLSSYAERCIMSAQALLAGLMPTTEGNSILPIPWQPVPVNSVPRLDDTLIAQKKPCAKYDATLEKMYSNPPPDLAQLNANNAELYHNLSIFTGKTIKTVLDVELLYNTLKGEEDMGLKLPAWTKGVYPKRLLPLAERSYSVFTDNHLMKRIKGGAFLGDVHDKMIGKAGFTLKPDRKLFLYSGHDVTLVNVMNSLGILDQTSKLPDYASALVFELYEPSSGFYEVRIVYYGDSDVDIPSSISIPNCPAPCSLDNFTESIGHLLFENYDEICENPKSC